MVFVSDNWILFLTDWVVFYLVRTGFDCFFEKNDEFRDFGVSGYFCFSPLVYAGGFGVFVVVGRGGLLGVLLGRDWCGSGCTGSWALVGVKFRRLVRERLARVFMGA